MKVCEDFIIKKEERLFESFQVILSKKTLIPFLIQRECNAM